MKKPETDHEWTIHSLNIHGQFFERWCQHVIDQHQLWAVLDVQHPVAFPPGHGKDSTADIRAVDANRRATSLVIECKKNNPGFVRWLFFKKVQTSVPRWMSAVVHDAGLPRIGSQSNPKAWSQSSLTTQLPMCDEAREVRANYQDFKDGDKTKTSNAAISEAADQVTLATFCTASEMVERAEWDPPGERQVVAPVIVTTATLSVCSFDPAQVSPATGEIPWDAVKLEDHAYLYYLHPIPKRLQCRPFSMEDMIHRSLSPLLSVLPILVVNSKALPDLLTKLISEGGRFHQTTEDLQVLF